MFPATLTSVKKPSRITSNGIINQLPGQVSCDETASPEIMHHRGAFDYLNPVLPPQILSTVSRFPKITPTKVSCFLDSSNPPRNHQNQHPLTFFNYENFENFTLFALNFTLRHVRRYRLELLAEQFLALSLTRETRRRYEKIREYKVFYSHFRVSCIFPTPV